MRNRAVAVRVELGMPGAKSGTGYGAMTWSALSCSPLSAHIYRVSSIAVNYDQPETGRQDVDNMIRVSIHRADNPGKVLPDFDDGRMYRFTPQAGDYAGKKLLAKRVRSYAQGPQVDCEKGTV